MSDSAAGRVFRNESGWPTVVELNIGETLPITREVGGKAIARTITLHGVRETWEPDFWIEDNPDHRTLACAEVAIEVSGERTTLLLRPYQQPVTVNGLRLYVEATRTWGTAKQLDPVATMGGLKARGHPVGATGVYQIVEAVEQLRGTCGENQLPAARIGMTQNIGGSGATVITHILEASE